MKLDFRNSDIFDTAKMIPITKWVKDKVVVPPRPTPIALVKQYGVCLWPSGGGWVIAQAVPFSDSMQNIFVGHDSQIWKKARDSCATGGKAYARVCWDSAIDAWNAMRELVSARWILENPGRVVPGKKITPGMIIYFSPIKKYYLLCVAHGGYFWNNLRTGHLLRRTTSLSPLSSALPSLNIDACFVPPPALVREYFARTHPDDME